MVRLAQGRSVTEDELRQHVAARIAKFKVPVRVLFLEENLPRNATGKVMKAQLREMFTD